MTLQRGSDPHRSCSVHEDCEAGREAECPAVRAGLARQALKDRGAWSLLTIEHEPGGLRHYLDGKPVHAGQGLELQGIEYCSDDYGEFVIPASSGRLVRYESARVVNSEGRLVLGGELYADVEGHCFEMKLQPWHRFRWPRRRS